MRTYLNLFFAFLFITMNTSCNEDDVEVDCITGEAAIINEVEAPETAKVGEVVSIEVTFSMKNTCGSFAEFKESSTEEGKIIKVLVSYFGCTCGQAIIEDTQSYEFTPESAGVYQLNFRSSTSELTTINIEVTE
ncbi:hypothetical protein NE848_08680 [Gramella jeungdoensis]|uniref:DUF1573 domain-containing protein n=1 Tax=Gramella jeungdoensis TaxID=708091 RepID=A0ABT0Z149_9FLAO|nr:hypothetical protein [Gramella jeungdoensis]MCM8569452.1 hypothetical protein [Gramella jeungdoensis]